VEEGTTLADMEDNDPWLGLKKAEGVRAMLGVGFIIHKQ
jgi:hypothetical protein